MKNLKITLLLAVLFWGSFQGCKKDTPPGPSQTETDTQQDVPAGATDGVTFLHNGTSAIFNLYAPGKKVVYLMGDFNGWKISRSSKMINSTDGNRWWIAVDGLDPAKQYAYQYYIDSTIKVADPYSREILDPDNDKYIPADVYPGIKPYPVGMTTGIVSVMQANPPAYHWKITDFKRPDPKNLVIYELLVRDFIATHSYKTLTDTLDYIARLGVNAIELMPVNEFEGNDSWGYNTNFMFALDKYYGTPNDYKTFIDACHARGIAVIQDIVLEDQFGSSPMVRMYATSSGSPSADNPWFDTENLHPYAVGYQMNHESEATRNYTKDVIKYWMEEYHIDGFRFDQAKGFTQKKSSDDAGWSAYDASRVAIWEQYNNYIKNIDPSFYVILEYFAGDQEEAELTAQGMMVWNNMSYAAQQSAMGYQEGWDMSRLFYDRHHFTNPYGLVSYFESHDEERMQFKNEAYGNSAGSYNIKAISTGLKRQAMAAAFLFSVPGPKMFWQFGERGYDISIDDNGRLGDKPPHWDYMADPERRALYETYAKMIKMKTRNPVFTSTGFQYNLAGFVKWIQLKGEDGTDVEVIGNFDVGQRSQDIYFPATGKWYDNLSGDSILVPAIPFSMTLAPGEYHVYSNVLLQQ